MPFLKQIKPTEKMLKSELIEEVKRLESKLNPEQKDGILPSVDFFEYMNKLYDGDKSLAYQDVIVTGAVLDYFDFYKDGWMVSKINDKNDNIKNIDVEGIEDFIFTTQYQKGNDIINRDYFKGHLNPLIDKTAGLIVHSSKRGAFDAILDKIFGSPLCDEGYYHHLVGYVTTKDEKCGTNGENFIVKKGEQYIFRRDGDIDLFKKFC